MKELNEYRQRLLDTIESKAHVFVEAMQAVKEPSAPLEEGGWNLHQVAAHVRDVQIHVYGMRVRRTVAENIPTFQNFDADAWNAEHYHADEPLDNILREFETDVREMLSLLRAQPAEAWNRIGKHETFGELSLQLWVERLLAHIKEHLETVGK
jgi:hypothetical protein